ncbi:hypothetical protein N7456_005343 [Penicillium angulare]|uniref:Zn(2)-C6 fungal-type domain-containing protein n=1 Tax=Penicillium angulare TaxID=116970 RepID=A0A9W9FY90_9EURO|nr:hypothetical protein N7456_005343 [Penicillium angulare]
MHENAEKRVGRRSRVACKPCNRRKVRCDVTQTGVPCTNCQHEAAVCEILPRKKHKPRMSRAAIERPVADELEIPDNSVDRATDATTDTDVLPDDSACSYIGDTRGPRQSVYELCHPGVPQEAYQSPSTITPHSSSGTATILQPHEIEYIRNEGGFSPLPSDVYDELVRCYFHHVHFFLPVVEAPSFLNEYMQNGSQKVNPLLFWSMLLGATNYVDASVLQRAGFASRKAMKKAMYKRAKAFYDVDRSADKLLLIQSVLLMSFWYTDAQDHTGASHWIGIATSLAQGIGLHRSPTSQGRNNNQPASERQSLGRRLWWTCLVRDRWVSLAKGRPMRIHDEDCDAVFPCADDVLHELQLISVEARQKFIPEDIGYLSGMWVQLVKTSAVLGRILRSHYRLKGPKPSFEEIDALAAELHECQPTLATAMYATSDIALVHEYHLQIFYQASATVLYRPYVLNAPASFPENSTVSWQRIAQNRAREAASTANQTLEKIIELDVVKSIKPMFITSLIPAMQIHLFDCKSGNSLQANLGKNRLNLCLLFLDNLRDTYWSAGVMYRLFDRAQSILTSRKDANAENTALQNHDGPSRLQYSEMHQQYNDSLPTAITSSSVADFYPGTTEPDVLATDNFSGEVGTSGYSLDFDALEQLLSPGFALSDSYSQGLYTQFNGSVIGDQLSANLYSL